MENIICKTDGTYPRGLQASRDNERQLFYGKRTEIAVLKQSVLRKCKFSSLTINERKL